MKRFEHVAASMLLLLISFGVVYAFNDQPAYTDAYYHYNGATRLAEGAGFTETYLWNFINAPDELPASSHRYWMPATSVVSWLGMIFVGVHYAAAQVGLAFCLWGASLLAYFLAWDIGGTRRHAWLVSLLVPFNLFFTGNWGQTDTFAPYALFGAGALAAMGYATHNERRVFLWWMLAGAMAALGHLTRTDGLILLLIGWIILLTPIQMYELDYWTLRLQYVGVFTTAYILVMSPWFVHNLNAIGTLLPVGGTQAVWYTSYSDLFAYPAEASLGTFLAQASWLDFVLIRLQAIFGNGGAILSFVAIEGVILFAPFILVAAWQRRADLRLRAALWFAVGIHAAFALVFPFPGMRGGLFHAVVALIPFWMLLGMLGIEDVVGVIAKRRKNWRPVQASGIFTLGATLIVISLSWQLASRPKPIGALEFYERMDALFEDDALVMINDPALLYYRIGLGGVAIPNEPPDVTHEVIERYGIDYVVLEQGGTPFPMIFEPGAAPDYLIYLDSFNGADVYAVHDDDA